MSNSIHPTAVIGPDVKIGTGNVIGPYCILSGRIVLGDDNWLGPHVVIGTPPEVRGFPHGAVDDTPGADDGAVRIGSHNIIHEFANVQRGWATDTVIGDNCFIMTQAHIAHDCVIGDAATVSSGVTLGGHAHVFNAANVGMSSVIHQRVAIGPGAMIGMGSAVRKDAPPFSITVGNPARTTGINSIGLERQGCNEATVAALTDYLLGRGELPDTTPAALHELLVGWRDRESH